MSSQVLLSTLLSENPKLWLLPHHVSPPSPVVGGVLFINLHFRFHR